MKSFFAAATACLLLFCSTAGAQTRTRRSSTPKRRTTTTKPSASRLDQTQVNAVRIQMAEQVKDLTRFLYLYGRLTKDLELTGVQTESADAASRTKAGVLDSVRAMRDRIDKLESQFRFTPGLERQYRLLSGVSRKAEQAEGLAAAGRFDQAGRVFVEIAAQLADVLIEL